jgi:hypothetical protein
MESPTLGSSRSSVVGPSLAWHCEGDTHGVLPDAIFLPTWFPQEVLLVIWLTADRDPSHCGAQRHFGKLTAITLMGNQL